MTMKKVLLIDDDEVLLELLSAQFNQAGYQSISANNGKNGLALLISENPDLIILDIMMPKMDGWEVCSRIRKISNVPIIMLSAKEGEVDILRGFRLGIDDYVTKPFSFAQVIARAGAVINRILPNNEDSEIITSGKLILNIGTRKLTVSGKIVELTPTEYRLLALLMKNFPRPISTEYIIEGVWGHEYKGETDHVKRYIWALRKKLESDPGNPQHILTERGFGYKFE